MGHPECFRTRSGDRCTRALLRRHIFGRGSEHGSRCGLSLRTHAMSTRVLMSVCLCLCACVRVCVCVCTCVRVVVTPALCTTGHTAEGVQRCTCHAAVCVGSVPCRRCRWGQQRRRCVSLAHRVSQSTHGGRSWSWPCNVRSGGCGSTVWRQLTVRAVGGAAGPHCARVTQGGAVLEKGAGFLVHLACLLRAWRSDYNYHASWNPVVCCAADRIPSCRPSCMSTYAR